LDSPLIITLLNYSPPDFGSPDEQRVLTPESFPYNGTVSSRGESRYTITGLIGGGYYLVELKLPSEAHMSLRVSTVPCRTPGTITGSGCLLLASPDGIIDLEVHGDDNGGTFILDINDDPLAFDIEANNQYFSDAGPANFPDSSDQGISSEIFVDSFNSLKKLQVAVSIIHHDTWELSIVLEAPDGRLITLSEDRRWDDVQKAVYTDYALAPTTVSSTRHYQAAIRPVEPLFLLDDINVYGTWRLHVSDEVNNYNYPSDGGVLLKWGIAFD
jgi:subtilisin-like proprotein convertase family protein